MLTKNFYSYMKAALQKTSATFTKPDGTTKMTGLSTNYIPMPPLSVMNSWGSTVNKHGVSFGTGTTPADVSNYCLESILDDTQISVTVPSGVSFSRGDTFDEYSVSFGVTNKTAEAIIISEVGLTAIPYNSGSSNEVVYVLVDRTVLDTPITIPAGQSKQITYTIRFNYGDAV